MIALCGVGVSGIRMLHGDDFHWCFIKYFDWGWHVIPDVGSSLLMVSSLLVCNGDPWNWELGYFYSTGWGFINEGSWGVGWLTMGPRFIKVVDFFFSFFLQIGVGVFIMSFLQSEPVRHGGRRDTKGDMTYLGVALHALPVFLGDGLVLVRYVDFVSFIVLGKWQSSRFPFLSEWLTVHLPE